jgi:TorA maturation chaperone TorD
MLVKDEAEWYDLIKSREPNLSYEPITPESPEEYVKLLENRREIYFQLFRGFTDPTQKLVEEIMNGSFPESIKNACSNLFRDSRIDEGLELISKFREKYKDMKIKKLWDNLSGEYLAVFYDGLMPWICGYESIYLGEKQTMGDVTQEVKDLYRMADYNIALRFGNDPPDDIKIEIEFMFRMCDEELKAWKANNGELAIEYLKLQREFMTKHLAWWIPYFCDDLINEEFKAKIPNKYHFDEDIKQEYREGIVEMDFYRGLAPITKALIEHDYNQIEAMLTAVESLDFEEISRLCQNIPEKDLTKENFHLVKTEDMTEADKPYVPPHPRFK